MTGLRAKWVMDRVVAALALIVMLPVMLLIAAVIELEHPGLPVFFADLVAGLDGKPFRFWKFRTMLPHAIDYDNRPEVHPENPLVTGVGRWLRRFKLDELPQLAHVVAGQMSLVGPRPMHVTRYERVSAFFRQRVLVRPGLTGIAQVSGNIDLSWDERMEMDIWYIRHWSMKLDLEIIYRTFGVILFGEEVLEEFAMSRRIRDHSVRVTAPGEKERG
jgi:lipopolysaccharide/colanic/teichoic acid biosynthesis glycosyltransferase